MNESIIHNDTVAVATMATTDTSTLAVFKTAIPDQWGERRTTYGWVIVTPGWTKTGNDLHTGVDLDRGPLAMLETLLAMLGACAESWPDGENADLFETPIPAWADLWSDELAFLAHYAETLINGPQCDGCDQDPWRKSVHYGTCPLATTTD